jgi:uncharacterized repeat protein (TIGR04076 family)
MSSEMRKCKITVLKRTIHQDLVNEYLESPGEHPGQCEYFSEGQEFVAQQPWEAPEGFCNWAWADIRKDILTVMGGGSFPGMKQPGIIITGCSDWFRPVLFKVEAID